VCDFKSSLFDLPLVILAEWQISRITMRWIQVMARRRVWRRMSATCSMRV
jgi:hypothetical protein